MRIRYSGRHIRSSATVARAKLPGKRRRIIVRTGFVGLLIGFAAVAMSASIPAYAGPVLLITDEEAKLPPPKGAIATDRRGITRGPKIELVADVEPVHSPMHLHLKFESYGGAKIDP